MQTIESNAPSGATKSWQCRHILTDGHRCGSRALRHEPFCYYHHTTRRPAPGKPIAHCGHHSEFELVLPEDRSAIQHNIGLVLQRIAQNQIDPRRAGLLLYGLQIAAINLPREDRSHRTHTKATEPVDEIITDETLGTLAPPNQLPPHIDNSTKGIFQRLMEELQRPPADEYQPEPETLPQIQATAEDPGAPFMAAVSSSPWVGYRALRRATILLQLPMPAEKYHPNPSKIPSAKGATTSQPGAKLRVRPHGERQGLKARPIDLSAPLRCDPDVPFVSAV